MNSMRKNLSFCLSGIFILLLSLEIRHGSCKVAMYGREHSFYRDLDGLVADYLFQHILQSLDDDLSQKFSPNCLSHVKDQAPTCLECINQKCELRNQEKCQEIGNLYGLPFHLRKFYENSKNYDTFSSDKENSLNDVKEHVKRNVNAQIQHHEGAHRTKRGIMDWLSGTWETLKGSVVKIVNGFGMTGDGVAEIGDGLEDVITPAYRAVRKLMTHAKENGGILFNASSDLFTTYSDCKGFQDCYEKSVQIMKEASSNMKNTDLAQTIESNLNKLKAEYGTLIRDIKSHPALQRVDLARGVIVNETNEAMGQLIESGKIARMEMATLGLAAMGFALDFIKVWTQCEGLENCQTKLSEVFKKFEPEKVSFLGTEISGFLNDVKKMAIRVSAMAFDSEIGKGIKRALKNMFEKELFSRRPHEDDFQNGPQSDDEIIDLKPAFKGIDQVMSEKLPESNYYSPYYTTDAKSSYTNNDSLWEDGLLNNPPDIPSDSSLQNSLARTDTHREIFRRSVKSQISNEEGNREQHFDLNTVLIKYSKQCLNGRTLHSNCSYIIGECGYNCAIDRTSCRGPVASLDLLLHQHGWLSKIASPLYNTIKIKMEEQKTVPANFKGSEASISLLKYQALGQLGTIRNIRLKRPVEDVMELADIIASRIWQKQLHHL